MLRRCGGFRMDVCFVCFDFARYVYGQGGRGPKPCVSASFLTKTSTKGKASRILKSECRFYFERFMDHDRGMKLTITEEQDRSAAGTLLRFVRAFRQKTQGSGRS